MAKKITGYIKLQVPAGAANPSPPIGPALGQRGLAIMEFCKQFNAQTQNLEKGSPIPVVITVYRGPLLHLRDANAAGVLFHQEGGKARERIEDARGATRPARVTKAQVKEIAEKKMKDLNCDSIDAAMRMVEGSARSMGIEVAGVGIMANLGKR